MTERLVIREGHIEFPDRPGLGTALRPEVLARGDAHVEVSDPSSLKDVSGDRLHSFLVDGQPLITCSSLAQRTRNALVRTRP